MEKQTETEQWKTWLDTQERWKQLLIHDIETKEYRINDRDTDSNNTSFFLAKTRGLKDDDGLYGSVLVQGNRIIATTKGKTPPASEMHSSHRSEFYGMLAGLVLRMHPCNNLQGFFKRLSNRIIL